MKVREVLADAEILGIQGDADVEIESLAYDSRRVSPGALFFAIRGHATDGALFIPQALDRGAAACVSDHDPVDTLPLSVAFVRVRDARRALAEAASTFYGHPSRRLRIAGVTGTKGKTTTVFLLDSIFRVAGIQSALFGTIQYRLGDQSTAASRTTPESLDLQQGLAQAVEARCTHVAMEVSSHALELRRVHGIRFAAAAFTNLTRDHLDFHPDMESYLRAKIRLFEELDPSAVAVVNNDVLEGARVAAMTPARVVTYGLNPGSQTTIDELELGANGFTGMLWCPWGACRISSPLPGRFNVLNALAAAATAGALGIDPPSIARGIGELRAVPGRMERIDLHGFCAVVDYAHTPDSLDNVLQTLRPLASGRVIAVFGCGGDRDRGKRPLMAAAVARHADRAFLTSDNPRGEDPWAIIDEAEAGFGSYRAYTKIVDRREAIYAALDSARPGDIVLIAGKGHEDYQILGSKTIHFSDREVVEDWKRARPGATAERRER